VLGVTEKRLAALRAELPPIHKPLIVFEIGRVGPEGVLRRVARRFDAADICRRGG
jgi:hypothetical protein